MEVMNTTVVWAISLLVQHNLGSSSGPVQSIVRCLDEDSCGFRSDTRQACLVFLGLNPPAHGPFSGIDC